MESEPTKASCRSCGESKNHALKHKEIVPNDVHGALFDDIYEVLQCMGCGRIVIRYIFSEPGNTVTNPKSRTVYFPPITFRKKPEWTKELDETFQDILDQIYVAIQNDLNRLAAMGVRALLEYLMLSRNGDKGTFGTNLEALSDSGDIGISQKDTLKVVLDTGSATIHRGYSPSITDVISILDITELVLRDVFINRRAMEQLKQRIPPRPSRQ